MAFIHTNFLTGNDTTGDGSTTLPYKTIGKALTVAVSNDFIKVAGGQWTPVTGDFTFTNSSLTVETSTSQVGIIAVNDVLTFEDGQFGFDKFHVRVTAVTATTLTLSTAWTGPTQVTSALYMINQFHYSTATNAAFETWVSSSVTPNGRTGITVSGGWSSDYTTQGGWTMIRSTNASPSNTPLATISGAGTLGAWTNNLIFDRLFFSRSTGFFVANITTAQSNSFAVKEVATIRGDAGNGFFIANPTARWGGLFNVDANTPVTMYVCTEQQNILFYNMNSVNPNNLSVSPSTNITVYQQAGATTTGGTTVGTINCGVLNTATQASPNKITMHVRTSYVTPGTAYYGSTPAAYSYGIGYNSLGSFYLQKGYVYCNAPTIMNLYSGVNYYTQIEDLEFVGPYASSPANAFYFGSIGVMLVDLSDEGKTIEQFKPMSGYTYGATGSGFDLTNSYNLQRLCQSNLSATQVKDAEGLKTIDILQNIYFKDPVNNWLRVTGGGGWANDAFNAVYTYKSWKLIGVKEKLNTPFTVTVRLKTDNAVGVWDQIALQYGPNLSQRVTTNITTTSSFADYYITVDPATYSDWNQFVWPMYIGIRSDLWNVNSNNQQAPICFIESINIS